MLKLLDFCVILALGSIILWVCPVLARVILVRVVGPDESSFFIIILSE